MKKTTITFLATGLLLVSGLKAQTIQEGMIHLYADRFKSAIAVFEKLLATNPNNIEATYWLGQTYFDMDDNAKARQLYEKTLATAGSAPLLLAGLGHADLHDNKTSEARQKFEAAITAATGKKGVVDRAVLTAIGRANVDAKAGDPAYAVQKLEAAAEKGEKNTETLLQLGNAYRKANPGQGGGQAFETYIKALQVNPAFAVANLRLAKIFESQKSWDLVIKYLNDAIKSDPNFTPAYYELFYYYWFYKKDYPEAESQLNKFIESKKPETDIQDQFMYAQLCWGKKDFACAITKAESVVAEMGDKTKPKVLKLLADANYQKGNIAVSSKDSINAVKDYANAKKYSEMYFAKEKKEDLISFDYKLLADILLKIGGSSNEILNTYLKGAGLDTVLSSKIDFLKQGADALKTMGDRNKEGDIRMEIIKLKSDKAGQRDIFDAGFAYYQGKDFEKSKGLFATYSQKWPEETYGWQMLFQIGRLEDTSMEKGLAVPYAIKYLEVLEKDTAKNKKNILSTAGYLAQYNANITKDKVKAVEYFRKMLTLDPANADIPKYIEQLEGRQPSRPASVTPKGKPVASKAATTKGAANSKLKTKTTPRDTIAKK